MKVKEIMKNPVITLKPDDTVNTALNTLVDKNISGAPVVDEENRLLGIMSEKDLLVSYDFLGGHHQGDVRVSEFMTEKVCSMNSESDIQEVSAEMVRRNIKRIPILEDGKVAGIVSRRDIMRAMRNGNL